MELTKVVTRHFVGMDAQSESAIAALHFALCRPATDSKYRVRIVAGCNLQVESVERGVFFDLGGHVVHVGIPLWIVLSESDF